MLTGSMAMNYYAEPRMTRDIEVVELGLEQMGKMMEPFGAEYVVSAEAMLSSIKHQSLFNIIHQESVIKVDFIIRKDNPYRKTEFARRQRIPIEDFFTWIVSKEDLIISKLFWAKDSHSELQLRDVRNLLRTGFDSEYLDQWVGQMGLNDLLQECRE